MEAWGEEVGKTFRNAFKKNGTGFAKADCHKLKEEQSVMQEARYGIIKQKAVLSAG
jgi:hypothetical protein